MKIENVDKARNLLRDLKSYTYNTEILQKAIDQFEGINKVVQLAGIEAEVKPETALAILLEWHTEAIEKVKATEAQILEL